MAFGDFNIRFHVEKDAEIKSSAGSVISTDPAPRFERALRAAGFRVHTESVYARDVPKDPRHTLFIGQLLKPERPYRQPADDQRGDQ